MRKKKAHKGVSIIIVRSNRLEIKPLPPPPMTLK